VEVTVIHVRALHIADADKIILGEAPAKGVRP